MRIHRCWEFNSWLSSLIEQPALLFMLILLKNSTKNLNIKVNISNTTTLALIPGKKYQLRLQGPSRMLYEVLTFIKSWHNL
jgi:hypothetical protein